MYLGNGIYRWPNGQTYDGEWIGDMKHGKGIMRWPDGKVFDGLFSNDLMTRGTLYPLEGQTYSAVFTGGDKIVDLYRVYNVKLADASGKVLTGTFRNGVFTKEEESTKTPPPSTNKKTPHEITKEDVFVLRVSKIHAQGLINVELFGKNDPFVELRVGELPVWKTIALQDTGSEGLWVYTDVDKSQFKISGTLNTIESLPMNIKVYDENKMIDNKLIGQCDTTFQGIRNFTRSTGEYIRSYILKDMKDKVAGVVDITFTVTRSPSVLSKADTTRARQMDSSSVIESNVSKAKMESIIAPLPLQQPPADSVQNTAVVSSPMMKTVDAPALVLARSESMMGPFSSSSAPLTRSITGIKPSQVTSNETKHYPGGAVYVGQMKERKRNGFGTMTWPNGNTFEGNWVDDKVKLISDVSVDIVGISFVFLHTYNILLCYINCFRQYLCIYLTQILLGSWHWYLCMAQRTGIRRSMGRRCEIWTRENAVV